MLKPPTAEQLREVSAYYKLELSDAAVPSLPGLIEDTLASNNRLHQLVEPAPEARYPYSGGSRPEPEENPPWVPGATGVLYEVLWKAPSPARRFSRLPLSSGRRVSVLSVQRA
jgi:hypothetical protein